MTYTPPPHDCQLCPRLAAFRAENRKAYPDYFNAPVPAFGDLSARLLVVGLAPGLKGANRTGRPFTGDYAGLVLYSSLRKYGFAEGEYNPEAVRPEASGLGHKGLLAQASEAADNFRLHDCRITNAVRCVPQANKPEPVEIRQCNGFLAAELKAMPGIRVILSLGQIAHKAVLMAFGLKQSAYKFGHGVEHFIPPTSILPRKGGGSIIPSPSTGEGQGGGDITLLNSYHCSRYNINTGALTQAMFDTVVERAKALIEG